VCHSEHRKCKACCSQLRHSQMLSRAELCALSNMRGTTWHGQQSSGSKGANVNSPRRGVLVDVVQFGDLVAVSCCP
jgi:hypothetical protein